MNKDKLIRLLEERANEVTKKGWKNDIRQMVAQFHFGYAAGLREAIDYLRVEKEDEDGK